MAYDNKKVPNKYTRDDYILLLEYAKGHILEEIVQGVLDRNPSDLPAELEQILLSQEFVSKTTNIMLDYMYYTKLEEIPLHINESNIFWKPIIQWRLRIGK